MSEIRTENDAVIQVAQEAARAQAAPVVVEPGKMYAFPTPDGVHLLDLGEGEYLDRLPAPDRKRGVVHVEDVDSFARYYTKHGDENSEIFVDLRQFRINAVLDAHTGTSPRWEEHALVLDLKTTKAWQAWTGHDRRLFDQQSFAEFIEDRLADIVEPSAADMLEIAQTFQAKTKVNFSSATPLASGDRRIIWEEVTDASAGAKGQLQVPTRFKIALAPLELPVPPADGDGDPARAVYGLEARFRYRVGGGRLAITYLLDDPEPILRDAVLGVVAQVERELGVTVLRGIPA